MKEVILKLGNYIIKDSQATFNIQQRLGAKDQYDVAFHFFFGSITCFFCVLPIWGMISEKQVMFGDLFMASFFFLTTLFFLASIIDKTTRRKTILVFNKTTNQIKVGQVFFQYKTIPVDEIIALLWHKDKATIKIQGRRKTTHYMWLGFLLKNNKIIDLTAVNSTGLKYNEKKGEEEISTIGPKLRSSIRRALSISVRRKHEQPFNFFHYLKRFKNTLKKRT